MSEQDERFAPLGNHLIQIEGDTIVATIRGVLTGEEMRQLIDHFARIRREHGALFVLYDGRECTGLDADARKAATRGRSNDADADLRVAFGVPFTVRVILNMILRARKILTNKDIAVYLFDKENEALAFLEKERPRIRQEKGIKKSL